MKLIISIFLILFSTSIVLANESSKYILITKTSKKSNLKYIKSKLDSINVKMFIKKHNGKYIIYSQKYNNDLSINNALNNLRKYFHSANIIEANSNKKNIPSKIQKNSNKTIFINLAYGFSNIDGSTDDINNSKLSNSGSSYMLEGGYIFNKNIFTSLAYLHISTNDIEIDNIYTSVNYKIKLTKNLKLFGGLLGGYSTLKLTSFKNSVASSAMLVGTQLGSSYKIYDNTSIYTGYQLIVLNHTINYEEKDSKLEFNMIHNIQLGFNFSF